MVRTVKYAFLILLLSGAASAYANGVCFKCHNQADYENKVTHKPVAEGRCSSCHNPHVARYKGLLNEESSKLCFSCHKKLEEVFGKASGIIHKPVKDGNCLACHDPHAAANKGLLKEKQRGEICYTCHKGLPNKFEYTHAPYAKGDCAACHKPHRADFVELLVDKPEKICNKCHNQNLAAKHKGYSGKLGACLTCHNPHGSSRAALIREVRHEPFTKGCKSCHSGGSVKTDKCLECHAEIEKELYNSYNHLMNKTGNSCVDCHSPHAADTKTLLKGTPGKVCNNCHLEIFVEYAEKPYRHPAKATCQDCHGVHGSSNLVMLKSDANSVCQGCHVSHAQFSHPVGEKIIDPRNGQPVTCVSCHNPHGTDFEFNLRLESSKDLCVQCHKGY